MSLESKIPTLLANIENHSATIKHNSILFDIYEGDLLKYIMEDLKSQLSLQSLFQAQHRVVPINVIKRVVNKISRIYDRAPVRNVAGDGVKEEDKELLSWYEKKLGFNRKMKHNVRAFNLYKNSALHLFLDKKPNEKQGVPKIRVIPSNAFLPYSDNPADPTTPTIQTVYMGERVIKSKKGKVEKTVKIFHAYSDEEFIIFNSDKEVMEEEMVRIGNPEGENVFGKIPIIYSNQSENLLVPKIDSDTLALAKIIPIMLSDLNYAVMFQAFSIIYGINLKNKDNLKMAPNAFWDLISSDPEKEAKVGQLKPQVDINEVLQLVQAEFALWLNTKGIRPGAIGQLTTENFASGISKMIDEMDVTEQRMDQVEEYTDVEGDFWDLVFNHAHPYWVDNNLIDNNQLLNENVKVETIFAEQVPVYRRGELVRDLNEEVNAGFTTRKRAIHKLNPHMSEEEVEELQEEIDEESGTVKVEEKTDDIDKEGEDDK